MATWEVDRHPRGEHGRWGAAATTARSSSSAGQSSSADGDKAVAAALAMLNPGEMPLRKQLRIAHPPTLKGSPSLATAWTDSKTGLVYISANTRAYRDALRGRAQELAAALVHERFHLDHGPDEGPAYDAEIAALQRLNAPNSLIAEKVRVRAEVTGTRRQADAPGGWLGRDDVHVTAAITILRERGLLAPDIDAVDVRHMPPSVNGTYHPSTDRISISCDSHAYARAERGDFAELASTLSHEAWHAAYGHSEIGAYNQSLRALRELGADLEIIVAKCDQRDAIADERRRKMQESWKRYRNLLDRRLEMQRVRGLRETADFLDEQRRLSERLDRLYRNQ